MLREMEDIAGDLDMNCFAQDHLKGAVYTIAPSHGLSADDVAAAGGALESNRHRLGDALGYLEGGTQQAKKLRVMSQERLTTVGPNDVPDPKSFTDAFPHLEQLRFLVQRMMDAANVPARDSDGVIGAPASCDDGLSSSALLRDRLRKARAHHWYPEDVPYEEPSGLPREHLERVVKSGLQNGAITAEKLADIAHRELGFDIRASMRCLELFESFEGPRTQSTPGISASAGTPAQPGDYDVPTLTVAFI